MENLDAGLAELNVEDRTCLIEIIQLTNKMEAELNSLFSFTYNQSQ